MANISVSTRDTSGIVISAPVYQDATATATAAEKWPAGAVLGKITATGAYARYLSTNTDGSEVPTAVLMEELVFSAAGDLPCKPLIAGRVRLGKLVDSADAALTDADVDSLRDYMIIAQSTNQLSSYDNQ